MCVCVCVCVKVSYINAVDASINVPVILKVQLIVRRVIAVRRPSVATVTGEHCVPCRPGSPRLHKKYSPPTRNYCRRGSRFFIIIIISLPLDGRNSRFFGQSDAAKRHASEKSHRHRKSAPVVFDFWRMAEEMTHGRTHAYTQTRTNTNAQKRRAGIASRRKRLRSCAPYSIIPGPEFDPRG